MKLLPFILWKTTFRYVFRSYVYLSLSVIGIATGVAVMVAVDLSGATASRQLRLSSEAILGPSTHQIVGGPQGVPDVLYSRIRRSGIRNMSSAPIVEGLAGIASSDHTVTIIGVDPFAELAFRNFVAMTQFDQAEALVEFLSNPNTAIVATNFIGLGNSVSLNDSIPVTVAGEMTQLKVVGVISQQILPNQAGLESIIFTDISTAQGLLGNLGTLSRIDVQFHDHSTLELDVAVLENLLPPSALLIPSNLRIDALEHVTKAFRLNLTALSFLALMVGVFLIYNTMSFSVVRRRTTMGLLRSIGVTRSQIMALFISESIFFGLISSFIGLLIGLGLAEILLNITVRTLSDVFINSNAYQIDINPVILLKGMAVGTAATMIAAIIPVYEATASSSTRVIRLSSAEIAFRKNIGKISAVGGILFISGVLVLYSPYVSVLVSLFALALVTVGMIFQIPIVMAAISNAIVRGLKGRIPVILFAGLRSIDGSLSRTAVAVCALSLAVAVTIGIGLMIGSFRTTVEHWLNTALGADIYISTPSINSGTLNGTINPMLINLIEDHDGISEITKLYTTHLQTKTGTIQLAVVEASSEILKGSLELKESTTNVWETFGSSPSVLISEAYSLRNNLSVGDKITLPTTNGPAEFDVIASYRDYSSTLGVVMFHHAIYDLHWQGRETSSIALYLHETQRSDQIINELSELSRPFQNLRIRNSTDLYRTSLDIFERTFELTSVIRAITVVVACIGILSALVAHQMERVKEGIVFRAIGLTPGQLKIFIGSQGVILGIYAGLFAVPLGIVISWFLINVINHRSFGWEMDLTIDWIVIGEGFLIAVAAASIAGLYPAIRNDRSRSVTDMSLDL